MVITAIPPPNDSVQFRGVIFRMNVDEDVFEDALVNYSLWDTLSDDVHLILFIITAV